jgi:hypothetical protein
MSHRLRRLSIAVLIFGLAAAAVPAATAASPAGATLSKAKRSLSWSGGPFTLSQPTGDAQTQTGGLVQTACPGGKTDSMCDHFFLKVNMGAGSKIKVSIVGSTTGLEILQGPADAPNDFDMYVYAPDGSEVGESTHPGSHESVTFVLKAGYRNKPYEVRIAPYEVLPGATYSGKAAALVVK